MTDRDLARALSAAQEAERMVRAHYERVQDDDLERVQALATLRLVIPVRRQLTEWISARAVRAVA